MVHRIPILASVAPYTHDDMPLDSSGCNRMAKHVIHVDASFFSSVHYVEIVAERPAKLTTVR